MTLCGVSKEYGSGPNRARVLHGIDLNICEGELTAVVGPSGSGKSTLLHLMGLLDRASGGTILLDGDDTASMDDRRLSTVRGSKIGFVFQFHHLLPAFSALENVLLPLMAREGRFRPWMHERAMKYLERMGLVDLALRRATDLSGGQQQRVAIARALAGEPRLILADEPTGNLDSETSAEVIALMREMHKEKGMALVIVTHDAKVAAQCERVVEIVDGRIASDRRSGK